MQDSTAYSKANSNTWFNENKPRREPMANFYFSLASTIIAHLHWIGAYDFDQRMICDQEMQEWMKLTYQCAHNITQATKDLENNSYP